MFTLSAVIFFTATVPLSLSSQTPPIPSYLFQHGFHMYKRVVTTTVVNETNKTSILKPSKSESTTPYNGTYLDTTCKNFNRHGFFSYISHCMSHFNNERAVKVLRVRRRNWFETEKKFQTTNSSNAFAPLRTYQPMAIDEFRCCITRGLCCDTCIGKLLKSKSTKLHSFNFEVGYLRFLDENLPTSTWDDAAVGWVAGLTTPKHGPVQDRLKGLAYTEYGVWTQGKVVDVGSILSIFNPLKFILHVSVDIFKRFVAHVWAPTATPFCSRVYFLTRHSPTCPPEHPQA